MTGGNFGHQFLTSYAYSTDEFQFGRIQVPPNRITNAIRVPGERVYYPRGEGKLIVNIMDTNDSIIGREGDALFVPADVAHQFQNPGSAAVEAGSVLHDPRRDPVPGQQRPSGDDTHEWLRWCGIDRD